MLTACSDNECFPSSLLQLNRVKVVEKEKNELEGAKNEAEEFLALQRDVARKQLTVFQRYMYVCSSPLDPSEGHCIVCIVHPARPQYFLSIPDGQRGVEI